MVQGRLARAVLCSFVLFSTAGFVFGWPPLQALFIEAGVPSGSGAFFDLAFAFASALVDLASFFGTNTHAHLCTFVTHTLSHIHDTITATWTNKRSLRLTCVAGSLLQFSGAGFLAGELLAAVCQKLQH
jgi:hypothetical protein